MKRTFLFIILLIFISLSSFAAETVVKGKVMEKGGRNAIEFANVVALNAENRVAASSPSDENGDFRMVLPGKGSFSVAVSFVGFKTKTVQVDCKGEEIDLGKIILQPAKEELEGAGITANTIIRRETDRIIYDVQADPDSWRLNMNAFMSKIPGLAESSLNGNLEYKGMKMQRILIDDEEHYMINAKRQYPMAFIKASYMSSIELVLPNSPEFKNENPILIIRLEKELPYGFAGQLSGSVSSLNRYSASPDIVFNAPKLGIGLNYSYNWSDRPVLTDRTHRELYQMDGAIDRTLESETSKGQKSTGHKIRLVLNKKFLENKLNIKVSMNTHKDDALSWSRTKSETSLHDGSKNTTTSASDQFSSSPFMFNGGINASYRINQKINLSAIYTFINSGNNSFTDLTDGTTTFRNTSENRNQEHNSRMNLRFNTPKGLKNRRIGNIEAGYMHRIYSENDFYGRTSKTGGMDYTQGVAYINGMFWQSFLRNRFSTILNLNVENIRNRGVNKGNGKSLDYDDFNVTPSITVGGKVAAGHFLYIGYGFKMRRPDPSQLDPYIDDSDPFNIRVGNPELKGEITHEISLNYSYAIPLKWWKNLDLNAGWNITPDAIESVISTDESNITTTTFANIGRKEALMLNVKTSFRPAEILSINLNATAQKNFYTISATESNSFWSFHANESMMLKLKWFSLNQDLIISPYGLSAQSKDLTLVPELNLSISRYWEKIKLGGSIYINDILHGRSDNTAVNFGPGFLQHVYRQRLGRNIGIRLYWRFGVFKQEESVEHMSYDR